MDACPVMALPPKILEHIFSFLGPTDLESVVRICQKWKEVADTAKMRFAAHSKVDRRSLAQLPNAYLQWRLKGPKAGIITVRSISAGLIFALLKDPNVTGFLFQPTRPKLPCKFPTDRAWKLGDKSAQVDLYNFNNFADFTLLAL